MCWENGLRDEVGKVDTSGNRDCQWTFRSVLKDLTDSFWLVFIWTELRGFLSYAVITRAGESEVGHSTPCVYNQVKV